jgi:hypothetical protein
MLVEVHDLDGWRRQAVYYNRLGDQALARAITPALARRCYGHHSSRVARCVTYMQFRTGSVKIEEPRVSQAKVGCNQESVTKHAFTVLFAQSLSFT